jgi:hypothetical protein
MTARSIKARNGSPNMIDVDDRRITLSMVEKALAECNRLNFEMIEYTKLLAPLRRPPPDTLAL